AQPAVPDLGPLPRAVAVAEVLVRRGDQAVDPGAEDAERHRPDGDIEYQPGRRAPGAQPAVRDDAGDDDPEHDAQGIGAEREGSEVPSRGRRARNCGKVHDGHTTSPAEPGVPLVTRSPRFYAFRP